MAHLYFHCHNRKELLLDRRGVDVDDMIDARDCALRTVQSLITAASTEDWRKWVLSVNDELGDEILEVPFLAVLGKPH